jgi:hypothetical protein
LLFDMSTDANELTGQSVRLYRKATPLSLQSR